MDIWIASILPEKLMLLLPAVTLIVVGMLVASPQNKIRNLSGIENASKNN